MTPGVPTAARHARLGVAAIFFLDGAGLATWIVRIPAVQERLGLTPGTLGLALLGSAIGAVAAAPIAGRAAVAYGSRPVTVAALPVFAASIVLPALAPTALGLGLALVVLGAANGVLNVSMNAHAAAVEGAYQRDDARGAARSIMSSFHALFSAGGLAGAAVGGVVAQARIGASVHLGAAALVIALAAPIVAPLLLPAAADRADRGDRARPRAGGWQRPPGRLLALGALAFFGLVVEGAVADWSAVYLTTVVGAGPGVAAGGYSAFAVMMAAGRGAGDALGARLGRPRLVRLGAVVAVAGVGLALAARSPTPAVAGFGAVGAGVSVVYPLVAGAASRVPGVAPSAGIALAAAFSSAGFLVGPPLIGAVAELVGLRGGLAVVGLAAAVAGALAGALGPARRTSDATGAELGAANG